MAARLKRQFKIDSGIIQTSLFDNFQVPSPTITLPSNTIPSVPVIPETLAEELFFEMDLTHPNYEIFQKVVSGNFDREEILRSYKPLGVTAKLENSRGLPDIAAKRNLNMGQFFTPLEVVKALTKATALDHAKDFKIIDNSCGAGNLLHYVYENNQIFGVEKDKFAFAIAKELYPKACIINDDLLNQYEMEGTVDAALINPPFSLRLEKANLKLDNAGWGKLGPRSSIESHIAALEIAINKADIVVGAIVPTSFFTNEKTYAFEKWVNISSMRKVLRIDLPKEAFQEYGTSWECSIVVYIQRWYGYDGELRHFTPSKMEELNDAIKSWMEMPEYEVLKERVLDKNSYGYKGEEFKFLEQAEDRTKVLTKPKLPLEYKNIVRVCINRNGSGLVYKPSDLLTGLMLHSSVLSSGEMQGARNQINIRNWNWDLRLASIIKMSYNRSPERYIENLKSMGIQVEVDPAVENWLAKKRREYERNIVPFEQVQYDEETDEWITLHENDGVRTVCKDLYYQQSKKLDALGIDWLWDYQRDDILRMSIKKSNLYAGEQATGKTRIIIGLGCLYGGKHNLIIVEPKLVDEFLAEFKNLGITDVQSVNSEKDIYIIKDGKKHTTLKRFNVISYRKLWSTLNKNTKKTYAKAIKKLINFVAIDEAHKIKKETKQGKTVIEICKKAKHVLESTGTPINNYPRNIYPLLVAGWGDATQLNEYGYYSPVKNNDSYYALTPGTKAFAEQFIRIEWVTEQFAQTLETGRKAKEIPVINDLDGWHKIIDHKMIRRVKAEPDVNKYMPDLNPVFHNHFIMPDLDHLTYYKYWLEEFASWFKTQLEKQKLDSSHNIATAIILAHLQKLDFASTIPQSPQINKDHGPVWSHGLTEKQKKVMELVKAAVENGEKVIVFSGRPDFQDYMQRKLEKEKINGYCFTGKQSTTTRTVILNDFKTNPDISVLFATTSCGDTGLNIPEASTVIFADVNWTPSKTRQAYSRILRYNQKREPHIHFVMNKGMVDEYMLQLCTMKKEGIDQAIDGHLAEEFDPDNWMSYKDFSYKMLTELGMI